LLGGQVFMFAGCFTGSYSRTWSADHGIGVSVTAVPLPVLLDKIWGGRGYQSSFPCFPFFSMYGRFFSTCTVGGEALAYKLRFTTSVSITRMALQSAEI
jgi:hypothetical protein